MTEREAVGVAGIPGQIEPAAHVSRPGVWLFRYRGYVLVPLLVGSLVALASGGPDSTLSHLGRGTLLSITISLAVVGHAIRIWSLGYAGITTRSSELNAPDLATRGPYAFCRNPMYWGNFFIGLGVALFAQLWWVLGVFLVVFWVEYYAVVRVEEAFLERRFPDEYADYCRAVPRFSPRLSGYKKASGGMDWGVLRGGEYQALVSTVLMIAFIELAKYIHLLRSA